MVHYVQRSPTRVTRVVTPTDLDEVLSLLDRFGTRAKVIAGGTDLMIELDRGLHNGLECLIDLTRVEGLDRIESGDGTITLGALVTHNRCVTSPVIRTRALPLAQACLEVGSPPLRNRATVVGNVVTASPANDTISALLVLDAVVLIRSRSAGRQVPLAEFHTGFRSTVLQPDELVTGIRLASLGSQWRAVYVKSGLRRAQAISVVHLALACHLDADDVMVETRLALGSVAPTVQRATGAEQALVGQRLAVESAAGLGAVVGRLAADSVSPVDDVRSTAEYRTDQVSHMVERAITVLAAGRQGQSFPRRPVTLAGATGGLWPTGREFDADHVGDAPISATVNGRSFTASPPESGPSVSLLEWIRHGGFTGVKEGCAEGECGACTVHLDDMAVLSCLIPATRAAGSRVTTIEGLGPLSADGSTSADGFDPIQKAFVNHGAVQCGYCIPGFLMAGSKLIEEVAGRNLDTESITAGLSGNLCRCTGYYKIIDAVSSVIGGSETASTVAEPAPPRASGHQP